MNTNIKHKTASFPEIGHVYFMVTYVDDALELPLIRSVVCIGKNIVDKEPESDEWYFQDVASYGRFGAFTDISSKKYLKEVEVHRLRADALSLLFDVEGLLKELGAWDIRKAK